MSYWINQFININYGLPCVSVYLYGKFDATVSLEAKICQPFFGAVLASSLEKSSREFLKFFNLATQRKI